MGWGGGGRGAGHFIGEERKEETQRFSTDGDRGHVSGQMKLMSFHGSLMARLKSRDGSLFLLFSSFTALRRGLGATRLRSGLVWLMGGRWSPPLFFLFFVFFKAISVSAIFGDASFKDSIRSEIKVSMQHLLFKVVSYHTLILGF